MYRGLTAAFVVFASVLGDEGPAYAANPSIKNLDRLIGTWRYEDRSLPALGFDYLDTGVRTCAYALNGAYIRCVSVGHSNGKSRTYEFSFNYNSIEERFEMVAMFSDYGPKQNYVVTVNDGGRRIDLVGQRTTRRGQAYSDQSWATIVFDGDDTMTWTTRRNRSTSHHDEWPAITVDNARRDLSSQ